METHLRTELVLDALRFAVQQRQPTNVIHHSDQGCQDTSIRFGLRCTEAGVYPSMGSVGDAYDSTMAESFFATLECELLGPPSLQFPGRGPHGRLRVHRGLVQPLEYESRSATRRSTNSACGVSCEQSTKPGQLHSSGQT
jgi:transposase InsO family protein